ncbi:hypothetical protein [Phytohabitans houttuyneae]|uniref:Uncharacterized protein n=1 Tax=Phytohabitans houttuyneae TaxID=1076126 RepID=A0A6V8KAP7_9ACTN|nr:hypothetical protein [Phytohabitans houttuyneae]GFJ82302.1 hypothetical protein Phou_064820 [Phytohabitans houttuyneae]
MVLKAKNRYYWSTRRQLEIGVARALDWLVDPGFPIGDPETIPDILRDLPMVIAAQLEYEPCKALERLIAEAIDYVDPHADDARRTGGDPGAVKRQAYKTVMLKQMFGLTPETRGKSYDYRFGLFADDFERFPLHSQVRGYIRAEYLPDVASYLCMGAADRSPDLPDLDELENALDRIITKGLPLMPEVASAELLAFLPTVGFSESMQERVARMDCHLHRQLDAFVMEHYAEAARIFFAAAPGTKGTKVKARMQKIALVLDAGNGLDNIKNTVRPKVLEGLAWQLYRLKLEEQNRARITSREQVDYR